MRERSNDMDMDWTEKLLERRDNLDKEARNRLGRAAPVGSMKRKHVEQEGVRRNKKKKYAVADEDWGMSDGNKCVSGAFLYSGLEGVQKQSGNLPSKEKTRSKALEVAARTNCRITQWMQPVIRKLANIFSTQLFTSNPSPLTQ